MEGRTAYRQHMTVFWSRAQHHVTTSLMKLAVGERNVATNLGTTPGCVAKYCFSTNKHTFKIFFTIGQPHYSIFP